VSVHFYSDCPFLSMHKLFEALVHKNINFASIVNKLRGAESLGQHDVSSNHQNNCLLPSANGQRPRVMRLCHPPDGSTSPKYKLLCFITTKKICKEKNALAFNWDRCCHLVLCLRLIPFHCSLLLDNLLI
jgi:hypothetical protein